MRPEWNMAMPARRLMSLAAAGLGTSCVITQLVSMREMLGAFWGNELTLGLVLSHWLWLSGIGAWLGRKSDRLEAPSRSLCLGLCLLAWLPPVQVFLLRVLREVILIRGTVPDIPSTVVVIFLYLSPYCLLAGFLLPLMSAALAKEPAEPPSAADIGRIYLADSLGSIAGGVLFSFVLVRWLDHFSLLLFPAAYNLLLAYLIARQFAHRALASLAGMLLATTLLVLPAAPLDRLFTSLQYPGHRILERVHSPYGRLVVTERDRQIDFYENGQPILSSQQIESVEETVHYAMAQRPQARRVLLVGGGVTGAAREIAKYGVEAIIYVELDPAIVEAGRRFLPAALALPSLRIVTADGRRFIRGTDERFDVVILDVPDPATTQINRFYTAEFFAEVKRVLAPGGVVSLGLGHYENVVNRHLARLLSSMHRTLKQSFSHILMIPGGRVYFIASDQPLDTHIAERLEAKHITTRLVKRSYLEAMMTPDRLDDLARAIAEPARVNHDFHPALFYYYWVHWVDRFPARLWWLELLPLTGLAIYLACLRGASLVLFAAGFAASALEMVLLLAFQAMCGSLYYQVGTIVTLFMAGLAAGAHLASRSAFRRHRRMSILAWTTGLYACALPGFLSGLSHWQHLAGFPWLVPIVIPLLAFCLALLAGMQFVTASQLEFARAAATSARVYLADYVGASAGVWLAMCLLPFAGVLVTCAVTGGLCFAAALVGGRSLR
jgi:spermidine synthase